MHRETATLTNSIAVVQANDAAVLSRHRLRKAISRFVLSTLLVSLAPALFGEESKGLPITSLERVEPVSFNEEILPILQKNCTACHNASKARGDVILENAAAILAGADEEPIIVAGSGAESLLVQAAAHQLRKPMPPRKNKVGAQNLTPDELGLLKLWIDQGAKGGEATPAPVDPWFFAGATSQPIYATDLSHDGSLVAFSRGAGVSIHAVAKGKSEGRLVDRGLVDQGVPKELTLAHLDDVQALEFHPRGDVLVSSAYRTVKVWRRQAFLAAEASSPATEAEARAFCGGGTEATSPDGKLRASVGEDGKVRVFEVSSEKVLGEFQVPTPVHAVAVRSDGQRLAVASGEFGASLWDVAAGKELAKLEGDARLRPDVERLERTEKLYDTRIADGKKGIEAAKKEEAKRLEAAKKAKEALEKAEKDSIAKAEAHKKAEEGKDKKAIEAAKKALDGANGARDNARRADEEAKLEVKRAQKQIAAAEGRLKDAEEGKSRVSAELTDARAVFDGSRQAVRALTFSPDGSRLVSGGDKGFLRLWDGDVGRAVDVVPVGAPVDGLLFGEEELLRVRGAKKESHWRLGSDWVLEQTLGGVDAPGVFSDRVTALSFSPDGMQLATVSCQPSRQGDLKIWNTKDWSLAWSREAAHSDAILAMEYSLDGQFLATCGADKFVRVFRASDGEPVKQFEGHTHHVLGVSWRSDGKELASCGGDKVIKVWDFEKGGARRTVGGFGKQVNAIRYVSTESQAVACSGDRIVRLLKTNDGGTVRDFGGSTDHLYALAISYDGGVVAAGGFDGVLRLWNVADGKLLQSFEP